MIVCDVNMCVQGGELVWAIHRHAERPDPGIIFYDRFKTGYIRVHSVHAAPRDVVQNVQKKDGVNTGVNENIDHNTTTGSKMSRAKAELKHGPHPAPPVLLCVTLRAVVYPGTLMHPVLNDEI